MIDDALYLIKEELTGYILANQSREEEEFGASNIVLENISDLEREGVDLTDKIVISLVNIEEESAFKNVKTQRRNQFSGNIEYHNPPVYLNLYILFSCIPPSIGDRYRKALNRLGLVIQFFQSRKIFTLNNSLQYEISANDELKPYEAENLEKMKVIMDLYTLTFEQINHLWGSLGGKQVPFAMYKARLVEIKDGQVQKGGSVITEINSNEAIY